MAGFAFPILLYQTLHPFSPYQRPHGRPRHPPSTAYRLLFKVITMAVGHHSLWTSRRHLLKCPRLPAGRPCQWPALHQTSRPSRALYGKQLLRELFFQCPPLLLHPNCCEIYALSIYLFYFFLSFFRKMAILLLTDRQHIACPLERFLPVASRFVIVLIGNVSIPISHGVLFFCLADAFD